MQLYVKMRDAIFSENGYCFDLRKSLPDGLRKESNVEFVSLDEKGKPISYEKVPGTHGGGDPQVCIYLRPYPDGKSARLALNTMCCNLQRALDGDTQSKQALGLGWLEMIVAGFALDQQQPETQGHCCIISTATAWLTR